MNISQNDIITVAYLFLIVGGIITLFGALTVYSQKKAKRKR
ncbi:MAG: hypothetical protein Q8P92_03210 [Candidatus Daviesbacteria bacterium]|nr:hypothetical protein [Candidatus Daviesbacteria bacterium]